MTAIESLVPEDGSGSWGDAGRGDQYVIGESKDSGVLTPFLW